MIIKRLLRQLSFTCAIAFTVTACDNTENKAPAKNTSATPSETQTQTLPNTPLSDISLSDIDKPIVLQLYDLDLVRYELRLSSLKKLMEASDQAQFSLQKPLERPYPPRLEVSLDQSHKKGHDDAPISLVFFCNAQSTHCARMQAVYKDLEQRYGNQIQFVLKHLPLRFHRFATMAANAAECAGDQDAFWQFYDAAFSQETLDQESLQKVARIIDLDTDKFDQCMVENKHSDQVSTDIALAKSLNIGTVPTTFINGLYFKGPVSSKLLANYVNDELVRQGLNIPVDFASLPITKLPYHLNAIFLADDESKSSVMISIKSQEGQHKYKVNDEIEGNVSINKIFDRFIVINNKEKLERLLINTAKGSGQKITSTPLYNTEQRAFYDQQMQQAKTRYQVPEPSVTISLNKQHLAFNDSEIEALEQQLEEGELNVEGKRLLRIKQVPNGSFYERLGLNQGDVLMMANEEWIHNESNPLWQQLQEADAVNLVVMRKGLPKTYRYKLK